MKFFPFISFNDFHVYALKFVINYIGDNWQFSCLSSPPNPSCVCLYCSLEKLDETAIIAAIDSIRTLYHMQCNFVVDGNGTGAIPRMDKNAVIIGKFTLYTSGSIIQLFELFSLTPGQRSSDM